MQDQGKSEIQQYCCGGESDAGKYEQAVVAYIEYYHVRARRCKFGFYVFSLIKIILIGILPVLQAAGNKVCNKL